MKVILFSGEMVGDTGPAVVNRAYIRASGDWLRAHSDHPHFRNIIHFITNRDRFSGVLVSSLSLHNVLLLVVARLVGRRASYLAHGATLVERKFNGERSLKKVLVERATVLASHDVICVSPSLGEQLRQCYPNVNRDWRAVLNGVDENAIERRPEVVRAPFEGRVVRILTVGARPIKNLTRLIEAVEAMGDPDVRLTVIGRPAASVLRCGEHRSVNWVSDLPHADVRRLMLAAHVYVQLSFVEPFGLAICEAAQEGCELLVTDRAGCLPLLSDMESFNRVDPWAEVDVIAENLRVLVRLVRSGAGQTHAVSRSWSTAAMELRGVLCAES